MCVETLEDTVQPQPHLTPHNALALPDGVLFLVYRIYLMYFLMMMPSRTHILDNT